MTETLDPRVGFSELNLQFKREKIGPQFDFDIVRDIKIKYALDM